MKIEIKKPLYETKDYYVVGIYNERIKKAKEKREKVLIVCKNVAQEFEPEWIIKNAEIIKKVFKFPEKPMELYKIFLPKKERAEKKELKKLAELGVF